MAHANFEINDETKEIIEGFHDRHQDVLAPLTGRLRDLIVARNHHDLLLLSRALQGMVDGIIECLNVKNAKAAGN